MKQLKWGIMAILSVVILGICWFFFQGAQKSGDSVDAQPLQVAELPK